MAQPNFFVTQRERVNYREYDIARSDKVLPLPPLVDFGDQQTSQSTMLLQKKKEMAEVQEELDRKKEEFRERLRRCKAKEEELHAKQQHIREQVIKFEKFLKENDAKRVRAHRKAAEEIKLREQKEQEIEGLDMQVRELLRQKDEMSRTLDKNIRYQRYLESVVQQSEEFPEVADVLARYATLSGANEDLNVAVAKGMDAMEARKRDLGDLIKEKQNTILVSNSAVADLQKKLEEIKSTAALLEHHAMAKHQLANDKNRVLGEIKMSIMNVYARCKFKQALTDEASLVQHLVQIQQKLLDYSDIIKDYKSKNVQSSQQQQYPSPAMAHTKASSKSFPSLLSAPDSKKILLAGLDPSGPRNSTKILSEPRVRTLSLTKSSNGGDDSPHTSSIMS